MTVIVKRDDLRPKPVLDDDALLAQAMRDARAELARLGLCELCGLTTKGPGWKGCPNHA